VKPILRKTLPVLVLILCGALGAVLIMTGPEAKRRPPRAVVPTVKVTEVQPRDYTVVLHARGTVTPRTQSTLIPEVSGRVIETTPNFTSGGFFEAGEVLVVIDPRDYENALTVARADLERARLTLAEEEAQGEQARRDWEKLLLEGKPNDLVLRRPQLASARAAVAAAEARVRRATVDLERTKVRAPYAGRVLDKLVDVGQYVAPGTSIAKLYAVDYVEVRLPLTDRQIAFVDLPEAYRGQAETTAGPLVSISALVGAKTYQWDGRIVRTEGSIDTRSRQLFVVAQIDNPYAKRGDQPPLKIGQFVTAAIEGHKLSGVFVLPRSALLGVDEVIVVDQDDKIARRRLEIVWRDQDEVIARAGLKPGERISLTPLPFATDGTTVQLQSDQEGGGTRPGKGKDGTAAAGEDKSDKKGKKKNKKKKKENDS